MSDYDPNIPTPVQIEFFREHGWIVIENFLSQEILNNLEFGVRRFLSGEREWDLWNGVGVTDYSQTALCQYDFASLQILEIKNFVNYKLHYKMYL